MSFTSLSNASQRYTKPISRLQDIASLTHRKHRFSSYVKQKKINHNQKTILASPFRQTNHMKLRPLSRCHYSTTKYKAALSSTVNGDSSGTNGANNHSFFISSSSALTAAFFVAVASTWMNRTNDEDDVSSNHTKCSALHPSPTPAGVGSQKGFEDKADSVKDLALPIFTSEQVAENNGKNGKPIWMSYGGVVYDVTDFVNNHPGGSERIMLAAGSAVEPFWYLYRQHFASDLPMRLMEGMIVGELDEKSQEKIDAKMEKIMDEKEDPYAHEPHRSEKLIVHGDQPMNAEVPSELITENFITPVELFYIRHHHPVPLLMEKEIKDFQVEIDLSAFADFTKKNDSETSKVSLTLNDIKKLPKVEVTTTLQCSGNRRGDMNKVKRTSGTSWGQGAISTARWGGARLVDVLKLVGVENPYELANKDGTQKHVRFESLDGMKASIHMEKAINPFGDVILAYEMNGEPIPRDHGFPLRAIVPGYSAVRNVKWVRRIEVSTEESEGAWQRGLNYKTLPPGVTDAKTVNLNAMPSMTESSLFSGITKMEAIKSNEDNSKIRTIKAKGWAWAGGGRNVVRVDVTGDGGKSWTTANIVQGGDQKFGRAWAWVFWECEVPANIQKDGTVILASKAVDMAFNSQPEHADHGWNVRGLGNNSWYRAQLKL